MSEQDNHITGNCVCGAVSYQIEGAPLFTAQCCCSDCQKTSGADHVTLSFFNQDQIAISGDTASYEVTADSGNVMTRHFCPTCGGRLFGTNTGRPGVISVTVGSMNNVDGVKPMVAVYTQGKRPWDVLNEDLVMHEKGAPAKK